MKKQKNTEYHLKENLTKYCKLIGEKNGWKEYLYYIHDKSSEENEFSINSDVWREPDMPELWDVILPASKHLIVEHAKLCGDDLEKANDRIITFSYNCIPLNEIHAAFQTLVDYTLK